MENLNITSLTTHGRFACAHKHNVVYVYEVLQISSFVSETKINCILITKFSNVEKTIYEKTVVQ